MTESISNGISMATNELLRTLAAHAIDARLVGAERAARAFCSLRAVEASGIYYATPEIVKLPQLQHAIVLCDRERDDIDLAVNSLVVTSNPQLAFYVLQRAYNDQPMRSGVHPTALVSDGARIDPSAYVGPYCVIGRCIVGASCILDSHVVLRDGVTLDAGVTIESHSTLGATGVAWVWNAAGTEKIVQPQTGGVRVGASTFIGTDVTIVRGSINEVTTVGAHCLIAHGTKIGHGCRIDDLVHFANNVTIAGSVSIGAESFLGSGCVLRPHIRLARGTTVGAGAVVVDSTDMEYTTLVGVPAKAIGSSKAKRAGVPGRDPP